VCLCVGACVCRQSCGAPWSRFSTLRGRSCGRSSCSRGWRRGSMSHTSTWTSQRYTHYTHTHTHAHTHTHTPPPTPPTQTPLQPTQPPPHTHTPHTTHTH